MAERFERELAWCIGQLECMMKSSTKDKDPREFYSSFFEHNHSSLLARSALQVLTNPKTSFIRKRQMMQQLFGDYRQKMHEEDLARQKRLFFILILIEKLLSILIGHNQIQANTNSEIPLASRFVRRIHSDNNSLTTKENTFSFNFHIPSSDMDNN
jgi:hypothetical protein